MNLNVNTQVLIRQIVARLRCAVCNHHFGASDLKVIGNRENVWAIRADCRECRTQALVLAVIGGGKAQPMHSDLTPSDWERFKAAPPISEDDVIAIHQHLQEYAGDFSEILDEPLPEE